MACNCCLKGTGAFAWPLAVGVGVAVALVVAAGQSGKQTSSPARAAPPVVAPAVEKPVADDSTYVLGFKMKDIDGAEQDLAQYRGKVVLIVNVASKCGYTPQYEGLQKLYESRKDAGLIILGFPANNFGGQEPGTGKEIKEFCTSKFHVSFPMFEKVSVKGDDVCPLYKKLAAATLSGSALGEPKWNFTKYLVDRSGHVVAKFDSKVKPDAPELTGKIDELLKAKP